MKRENVREILNKTETIDYVLEKLNNYYQLPSNLGSYVVAGGSVASILNGLVNNVQHKINDIDVYTWKFFPDDKASEVLSTSTPRPDGYSVIDSEFTINRVEQPDPKLDIIDIKSTDSETGKNLRLPDIILTFDLNCTQVAISPEERKLYYTEEFLDFLTTRQIELQRISLGSILRAVRKADELHAYFDVYKASILVYERQRQPLDNFEVMEACSKKCYEKHINYIDKLQPHIAVKTWDGSFYFPEVKIEDHPVKFAYDAMQMYHFSVPSKLIVSLYNRLNTGKSQNYRDVFKKFSERELLSRYLFHCPKDYIGINPELSKMEVLEKFLEKHPVIADSFILYDYTQQLQLMNTINRLEDKYGTYAIGVLETNRISFFDQSGLNIQKAIKAIEEKAHEQEAQLVKKLLPRITSASTVIQELVCINDLQKEGKEMKHCVGGYGRNLKTNHSRIFSIQDKENEKDRSTVQLLIEDNNGKMQFKIKQHYAMQNKPPTPLQKKVVAEFVRILNGKELPYDEYNNDVPAEMGYEVLF